MPELGLGAARCAACGVSAATRRVELSDSFVSYGDIFCGGAVCETCYTLIKDQRYRRSHWVVVGADVKILDKSGLLEALLSAPEGSLVYVKSRGQRLTYLRALRHRSTRSYIAVCGEDEGLVLAKRDRVKELADFAKKALSLGLRKVELLEGCGTRSWAHRDVCAKIEEVRGDPLWRIIARAL